MERAFTVVPAQGVIGYERELLHGVLAVMQDGARIGLIRDGGSDWLNGPSPARTEYRVIDAGPAIPVPSGTFTTAEAAACAIVEARCVNQAWLVPGADGLTELERRALEFETTPDAQAADGRREKAIGERFRGLHPTAYAVKVSRLLTERYEAALAANPEAVAVLDRRRARRRRPARGIGGGQSPPPRAPQPPR